MLNKDYAQSSIIGDNPDEEVMPGLSYEMQQQALHGNKVSDVQKEAKSPKKASFF